MVFDIAVAGAVVINALEQPYRLTTEILWRLRDDGLLSLAVSVPRFLV